VTGLLIHGCEVDGIGLLDVRIADDTVVEIASSLRPDGEEVLDARGGALIPGLHDHHLHLFALAADLQSVSCAPTVVPDRDALATVLRGAAASGPVRGTGYFETVAGPLDRDVLDALVPDVPVRVQHRSGAVWFLNSTALSAAGLLDSPDAAVERDANGRATGRIVRGDHLLRGDAKLPDLSAVGRLLASYGVTGVTDATPRLDVATVIALHQAQDSGALPQRMLLLGASLEAEQARGVPWKVVVDELVGLNPVGLVDEIVAAHDAGRPVAIHCTSRVETVLAATTLLDVGAIAGDRLEHAGILPRDLDSVLAQAGVTVVTQPHFITERGDDYLINVEPDDHDLLYRCGSLIAAGVPVGFGTDAPYGRADPWTVIAAATTRRTESGVVIAPPEQIGTRRALRAFLGGGLSPGGLARRLQVGARADLCLLDVPLDTVLAEPVADHVAATIVGGQIVFSHQR
jgi:predicted amidohydrolase YtcJ